MQSSASPRLSPRPHSSVSPTRLPTRLATCTTSTSSSLAMAAVVFVAVEGALLYAIFRYRRRSKDELPAQTHGSNVLELIWTGIPVVIVLALFTYSFIVLQDVNADAEDGDLTIDVTGFQFQWQFDYALNDLGEFSRPDSDATISIVGVPGEEPTLVMPVDEPVEFVLNSSDVIHSFYVPKFLYKLDVIPGQENRFVVTARETGTFAGQCAELCGVDHALMRFNVEVVEREEFDAWVEEQAADSDRR
ncbi:MAG: cytochrome c oxidase subunit II [Dehalococcoidia bacterium]|nr:cytochrome c oxidase subunit II [Dehalococcoidia bacterium]